MIIKVGNRNIGEGQPCFLVAEIGINHNGDMDLCRKMIDAAAKSGADAVKFQNYYTEDFILDHSLRYAYQSQGNQIEESQFDMFKRCELNRDQLIMISKYCESKQVIFFSTPTSKRGIDDLIAARSPLLKNGSDYLVNLPLIEDMARTGLPTIISTGMSTAAEVDDAVRAFERAGGNQLVILHCTSSYPTPDNDVHLNKIVSIKKAFGYPVGFSDHTWGIEAGLGSVMLGSCFIEKHFTLDRNLPGPDHRFSSDPLEFSSLVAAVRKMERIRGDYKIGPTQSEEESRTGYRLSCGIGRDMSIGETIENKDVVFIRPGTGIPPKLAHFIIGRGLKRPFKKGELINFRDLN